MPCDAVYCAYCGHKLSIDGTGNESDDTSSTCDDYVWVRRSDAEKMANVSYMNSLNENQEGIINVAERICGAIRSSFIDPHASQKSSLMKYSLIIIFTIVVSTGILTFTDNIAGESFTFLMGTVVGYLLTAVRKVIAP